MLSNKIEQTSSQQGDSTLRSKKHVRNEIIFHPSRDETGKFPDYPSDEEGGSAIVFNPELRAKMLGEGESWEREESSSSDEEGKATR